MAEFVNTAPVEIHSVLFRPDGVVEITFAERADITPKASKIQTVVLDREEFRDDIQDVELALFELVDEGLLAIRNPPAAEPARKAEGP